MSKVSIDLGRKNEMGGMCCPSPMMDKDGQSYPYVHLTLGEDADELPECGEITFKFVRTRKTEETPQNGKERCEYSLDLTEIIAVKDCEAKEPAKAGSKETYAALDAIAAALSGQEEEEED
jgi:hypothetical protein